MIDESDQESPPHVHFVVADRYAEFARNESVITFSELLGIPAVAADGSATASPGLGIDPIDWEAIRVSLKEMGRGWRALDPPVPGLSRHDVLKLEQANVLLAGLRATGPASYRADLVVHRESEMLLDHTAERQHIPGMLIVEAACQMLIAATSRFLRERRPGVRYYSVMKNFEIEFRRFVFPLPACLDLTVEWWDEHDERRPSFRSLVEVAQGAWSVPEHDGGIARSYRGRCLPSRRHRPGRLLPGSAGLPGGQLGENAMRKQTGITGVGAYLPLPVRTNDEIAARFGLPGEWIEQKTGIRVRHVAEPHESVSDMAAAAAQRAIRDAGTDSRRLGLIVATSSTPGRFVPSIGCGVQRRIGADRGRGQGRLAAAGHRCDHSPPGQHAAGRRHLAAGRHQCGPDLVHRAHLRQHRRGVGADHARLGPAGGPAHGRRDSAAGGPRRE